MMIKQKQHGFTIVELLIVIIVAAILAVLAVTTSQGIDRRERDTNREHAIELIHKDLETYYQKEGFYPALENLQNDKWIKANLLTANQKEFRAPQQSENSIVGVGDSVDTYVYSTKPEDCDNTNKDCQSYTLIANLESGGTAVKKSLR